jgi:hypothetical protein
MYSDIEIEWSESMRRWVVLDAGRAAGNYKTYEEAEEYADALKHYYGHRQ